jgi:hypothetical protein
MTSAECTFPDIDTTDWTSIETSAFSLRIPPELRRQHVQGYDSLVGKWQGDDAWISYDFGRYSGPPGNLEDFAEFRVCVALIDEREARVATYRRDDGALAIIEANRDRLLAVVAQVRFRRESLPTD